VKLFTSNLSLFLCLANSGWVASHRCTGTVCSRPSCYKW